MNKEECLHYGWEWVESYHKRNGTLVHGYCKESVKGPKVNKIKVSQLQPVGNGVKFFDENGNFLFSKSSKNSPKVIEELKKSNGNAKIYSFTPDPVDYPEGRLRVNDKTFRVRRDEYDRDERLKLNGHGIERIEYKKRRK